MRRPTLRRAMQVLAALGIALTVYLTIVHYEGLKPVCTAGQACIKVQTSQWSELAGVPVALIGLIGYIVVFATLLAPDREQLRLATLLLTLVGFSFSVYLTWREGHSIHAYCEECLTSAAFLTLLMLGSIHRYLTAAPLSADPAAAPPPAAPRAGAPRPRARSGHR